MVAIHEQKLFGNTHKKQAKNASTGDMLVQLLTQHQQNQAAAAAVAAMVMAAQVRSSFAGEKEEFAGTPSFFCLDEASPTRARVT